MKTLSAYGVRELDRRALGEVSGGNPVNYGIAIAAAFGWGLRYGYTVVGPWLMGHDQ